MSAFQLHHPVSDHEYKSCFQVMQELRPHLGDETAFISQVRRQAKQGYRLLAAKHHEQIQGLAGYRIQENLLYGRFLYVDDLVITGEARRHGIGEKLITALRDEARQENCAHFVLDTGLANALGQRFYYRQGLLAKGLHFCQAL